MSERVCPQCGAQADPNAKVCIYCGTPLEGNEPAAPEAPVSQEENAAQTPQPEATPYTAPAPQPSYVPPVGAVPPQPGYVPPANAVPPQQGYTSPAGAVPPQQAPYGAPQQTPPQPQPPYGYGAPYTPPAYGGPRQQQFCKQCGRPLTPGAAVCVSCGVPVGAGNTFCPNCGQPTNPMAAVCVNCGAALAQAPAGEAKSKLAAGLLGIFLGSLGVHNFYLGYTNKAVAQLLICLLGAFACGIGPVVSAIWGLVEGIQVLTGTIKVDAKGVPLSD